MTVEMASHEQAVHGARLAARFIHAQPAHRTWKTQGIGVAAQKVGSLACVFHNSTARLRLYVFFLIHGREHLK